MACIEARGLRKAFGATIALDGIDCGLKRAASWGSSVPTEQVRPPRSTRFSASLPIREN